MFKPYTRYTRLKAALTARGAGEVAIAKAFALADLLGEDDAIGLLDQEHTMRKAETPIGVAYKAQPARPTLASIIDSACGPSIYR